MMLMARPEASLARCSFIDCFMHENGAAVRASSMCALPRGQRWLGAERTLARPEASPGLWLDASREGLARGRRRAPVLQVDP